MDETNRKLVEDYMNAWSGADTRKLESILDNSFKFSNPPPGFTPDRKGAIEMAQAFHKGFPDLRTRYTDWVIQGDKVAVRFIGSGTHKGEFMGVPATDKKAETSGIAIVTVRNGKIVNDTTEFDALGLMTQIGAIPPLGESPLGEASKASATNRPPRPSRSGDEHAYENEGKVDSYKAY